MSVLVVVCVAASADILMITGRYRGEPVAKMPLSRYSSVKGKYIVSARGEHPQRRGVMRLSTRWLSRFRGNRMHVFCGVRALSSATR
jgi:hypothetical protein